MPEILNRKIVARLRSAEIIAGLVAGPVSLIVWPMPGKLVVSCLMIGAVTGALFLLRDEFLGFVGLAVFLFGIGKITDVAARLAFPWNVQWWQPPIVAATALAIVFVLAHSRPSFVGWLPSRNRSNSV